MCVITAHNEHPVTYAPSDLMLVRAAAVWGRKIAMPFLLALYIVSELSSKAHQG